MAKDELLRRPFSKAVWQQIIEAQKDLFPPEYLPSGPLPPCTVQCTDRQENDSRGQSEEPV
jgi:hypothetical protein